MQNGSRKLLSAVTTSESPSHLIYKLAVGWLGRAASVKEIIKS